jgi:hypothetical protein
MDISLLVLSRNLDPVGPKVARGEKSAKDALLATEVNGKYRPLTLPFLL